MNNDLSSLTDGASAAAGFGRDAAEVGSISGFGVAEVRGPDGELKQRVEFHNLITEVGDQMYGERGAGLAGQPAAPTGMRLGTGGGTAPSKTGAGAAAVAYVTGSAVAIGTPVSSLQGSSRRITYSASWGAGVATATGINEVVLTNATVADVAGTAADTISRALLSPTVNKGAGDTLAVTWTHDLLGA